MAPNTAASIDQRVKLAINKHGLTAKHSSNSKSGVRVQAKITGNLETEHELPQRFPIIYSTRTLAAFVLPTIARHDATMWDRNKPL